MSENAEVEDFSERRRFGPDTIAMDLSDLTDLLDVAEQLNALGANNGDPAVKSALLQFNALVSRIFARYATEVLERSGGPGRSLHPLVAVSLTHLLDVPAEVDRPQDIEDRQYRRWLAGRLPKLDPVREVQFRQRWTEANGNEDQGGHDHG